MKQGLLLPGYACKSWIWQKVQNDLNSICQFEVLDWPTNLTPDFNSIYDFARWVKESKMNLNESFDFIIGHSMGGLVALNIAKMETNQIKKVILVESFITSPGSFFQNLMMEETPIQLTEKVTYMLQEEQKYYSEQLKHQLRELDMTDLVTSLNCEVIVLYGDRGCNNFEKVLTNLQWTKTLQSKISIEIINHSCHFPMLENPKKVTEILKKNL